MAQRSIAMGLSVLVSLGMLVGKTVAWRLTGSSAILSDALESVIHLFATSLAAWSLTFSSQPADREHNFGHGKAAYFSAGFEGTLIGCAALAIIAVGVDALIHGPQLHELGIGVAIIAGLALINGALGLYLIHVGKKENSIVLKANGTHVFTDMWTSGGVVVGVLLVWLTGIKWLDPLVAILVGFNILWSAADLMSTSFRGLMDQADPKDTARLAACMEQAMAEKLIHGYHQLRHRRINDELQIEAHLLFPGRRSLEDVHAAASELEHRISDLFPADRVRVLTHLEPVEHEEAHPDGHCDFPDPLLTGHS